MTRALGVSEMFDVLFELICAPFYGVDSPLAVTVLMIVISITSYAFLGKMPSKKSDSN